MDQFRTVLGLSMVNQIILAIIITLFVMYLVKLIRSAIADWKREGFKGIIDELIKGGITIGVVIALFFNVEYLVTFFEIIGLVFKAILDGFKAIIELIIGSGN